MIHCWYFWRPCRDMCLCFLCNKMFLEIKCSVGGRGLDYLNVQCVQACSSFPPREDISRVWTGHHFLINVVFLFYVHCQFMYCLKNYIIYGEKIIFIHYLKSILWNKFFEIHSLKSILWIPFFLTKNVCMSYWLFNSKSNHNN